MKYKIFMQAYDQYVIILLTDFTWITIKQSCTLFLQVVELHFMDISNYMLAAFSISTIFNI